jgi:hypothetical protein
MDTTPFLIEGKKIEWVDSFEYLGRMLSADDTDDIAIYSQLEKAKKVWGMLSQLLKGDGADVTTMCRFYRTIVHQTLLYASATWTPSNVSINHLERFQARCARGMTQQPIHRCSDKTWIYPHTSDILHQCQLHPLLHDYILRRRKHLRTRYATCESQLYGKCSTTTGSNRLSTWWNLPIS